MNRMSLKGWLLLLPIALLAVLTVMVGLLIAQSLRGGALLDIANQRLSQRQAIATTAASCGDITQRAIVWTMTRRVAERRAYQEARDGCHAQLESLSDAVDPAQREGVAQIAVRVRELTALLESIQADYEDEAKMRTVGRLEREVKPVWTAISASLNALVAHSDGSSQEALAALGSQQDRSAVIGTIAGLLALLCGAAITTVVLRRMVTALTQARDAARLLADGDLSRPIVSAHRDEVGSMLMALEEARRAWVRAISDIHGAAARISMTSSEIQQGASMINESAADASRLLGDASLSMRTLVQGVERATDDARAASRLAGDATAVATKGGQVVRDVASTMGQIQEASARISEINAVIDGIAFQTNILALNAAVEAARAGSQGRGFAVVASEVRALAQRSAKAAGEIRELIETSVARVRDGTARAQGADRTIDSVCVSTGQVAGLIAVVSDSAAERAGEIRTIAERMDTMSSHTQENAETARIWAGSAAVLEHDAVRLQQLVQRFRLPVEQSAAEGA
jgi:methyl-accepting chemotaxis protein